MREWATQQLERHPEVLRIGYFGSYARGDWGVGSDIDLIAIVQGEPGRFERRALSWDTNALPVPADLVVYSRDEWERLITAGGRFVETLRRETIWVFTRPEPSAVLDHTAA